MRLVDVVTSPWALQPEKLLEIRAIYETHLRGERIDIAGVEARIGQPLVNEPKPYQVIDGVAVVPLIGVLAKRANLFMQISGGISTQIVGQWLAEAAADPKVAALVLEIDSPGGQVDGVQVLAQQVAQIRESGKPVLAWISGVGASGAYWIASAADRIYIADQTTLVGSIGVVATHVDVSAREAQNGVKTTEITAGRYKRIASSYAPLSEEGRATIQQQVDAIYSVFVESVAANRGVDVETVLSDMADGRVFIGQQAIDAGLVDGVSTLGALIESLKPGAGAARTRKPESKGVNAMDIATLKAEHPEVFKAVRQEGYDAGLLDGTQQGTQAERDRIAAIDASAVPGYEALTAEAKAKGMSAGEYGLRVLAEEKVVREQTAAALKADAPAPAPAAQPADTVQSMKRAEFAALSPADQKAKLAAGVKVID
jgi:capsid assembly protease